MKEKLATACLAAAVIVIGGASLWAFGLTVKIIFAAFGSGAAGYTALIVGLFIFPITLFVAPFYAGFALGDWSLLQIGIASTVCALVLIGASQLLRPS